MKKFRLDLLPQIRAVLVEHPLPWPDSDRRILAQLTQESQGNPFACSHAGARGLMQVMEPTAKQVMRRLGIPWGTWMPYSETQSILLGIAYMSHDCAARFAERAQDDEELWSLSLAAYNTGPGRVNGCMKAVRPYSYQEWKDRGRPDGEWRTFDGIAEEILDELTAAEYCDPAEPIHYVRYIRRYYDIMVGRGIAPAA